LNDECLELGEERTKVEARRSFIYNDLRREKENRKREKERKRKREKRDRKKKATSRFYSSF